MKNNKKNKEKQRDIEKERQEFLGHMKKAIDPKIQETLDLIVKMNQQAPKKFEIINSHTGTILHAQ